MIAALFERYGNFYATWSAIVISVVLTSTMFLCAPLLLSQAFGQSPAVKFTSEEVQRLGQRMYREGILPSGEAMQSETMGNTIVPGTTFACVSCHLLSGIGAVEGGVTITSTNGAALFIPRDHPKGIRSGMSGGMGSNKNQLPPPPPPGRPAYTDENLASVLREGIDPSGRTLDLVMPRYKLSDQDMAVMIAYLKSLSSTHSPGVDSKTLRFATVITEDVPAELRYEQAALLEKLVKRMNEQAMDFDKRIKDPKQNRHMSKSGKMLYRNLTLSRWLLKGQPETWRAQLDEYYSKEPVFALLGGITSGEWKPIHEFSESNRIPCLLPQTDFPVISDNSIYTLYLSKGYYQEGETAARFLDRTLDPEINRGVVHIIRESRQGRALSTGFEETWRELGHPPPLSHRLRPGESINREMLEKLIEKSQSAALVVWDGPESMPLLSSVPDLKNSPSVLMVSSSYLGNATTKIPEHIREMTYISYPYRLPQDEEQLEQFYIGSPQKDKNISEDAVKIAKRTYPLVKLIIQAMSEMKENLYRDYLLDLISMNKDLGVPLYERLSFGPGQCYASKGCYIVQLSKGVEPTFIKKSVWVSH